MTGLTPVTCSWFVFYPGAASIPTRRSAELTGTAGTGFSVTVQSQDASGNPASPTSSTTITLTKGSGTSGLSGTLTRTIGTSATSTTTSGVVDSGTDTLTWTATATA